MGVPLKLSESQRKRLISYLDTEVRAAIDDVHQPLQQRYERWNDLYYGNVEARRSDWMSNFPVLMGATYVDAVTARLLNTTFAYSPTWTLQATKNSGWQRVAKKTEQFLDFKVHNEMNLYKTSRKAFFECTRLGTGAIFHPWVVKEEKISTKWMFWNRETKFEVVNGVVTQGIPMRHILFPVGWSELDELPWWGRRLIWAPQLMSQYKKYYDHLDEVKKHVKQIDADTEKAVTRVGELPGRAERIYAWEIYLLWDLKEDGDFRRYIVTFHDESLKIMRFELDTYPEWPVKLLRYGPRDYGVTGLGIMEMVEPFDNALYSLLNLLVDNFKVATMQAFKARKGVGIHAKTKIYPAKIFLLDNPLEDLIPFQMGQPFQLDPRFPRLIQELAERRSGVSDYALGRESAIAGSRATATGTLALIQEGQRRFDMTIRDIREQYDALGMFNLRMIHNRLPKRVPYMVLGDDGQWVEMFLDVPTTPPYLALGLKSSMSHVAVNKEVEKQDAIATFQLLGQYYQQVIQLMGLFTQTPDPIMKSVLQKIMAAASEKLRKVLEAYGEMSPEMYTEVTKAYAELPQQMEVPIAQ
ncbi:MAG: hypothetical protein NWE76_05190 [Candidatus Bathyarchaeota archaeon]|nr:hypothetical protein [Candidatus Bathyarchaeota archaeon]